MALKTLPHGRLQEWVAEEQGYFAAEGLDLTFLPEGDYGVPAEGRDEGGQLRSGAFETFGAGRGGANISCACHRATNAAGGQWAGRSSLRPTRWRRAPSWSRPSRRYAGPKT
jgi:NitT/TauT family transport system substrate-binding protein